MDLTSKQRYGRKGLTMKIEIKNSWGDKVKEFTNLKDFEKYVNDLNRIFGDKLELDYIENGHLIFYIMN